MAIIYKGHIQPFHLQHSNIIFMDISQCYFVTHLRRTAQPNAVPNTDTGKIYLLILFTAATDLL